ncbi:TPA: hypothetical protein ACF3I9_004481 [Klebsiella aerogenes]
MDQTLNHSQVSQEELDQLERISAGIDDISELEAVTGQKFARMLHHYILASRTIRAWEVALPRGHTLSYTGSVENGDKPLYAAPHLLSALESVTENKVWPTEIHNFVANLPTFTALNEPQQIVLKNCLLRMLIEQIPLTTLTENNK